MTHSKKIAHTNTLSPTLLSYRAVVPLLAAPACCRALVASSQVFSVMLDPEHPGFAESTIFVAGDRVTTDLIAQPFSMGRNLLCIFSKKHVDNPPELKSQKKVRCCL